MMITISRSQSRITSSTFSIWKNTYSNFNMVTIDFINTMTIFNMDIIHGTSPSNTTISYQTSKSQLEAINLSPTTYVLPCRPAAFKHDDQQLRHRHRYDLPSATDMIHLAFCQSTILRKRQLYSRQKLRNKKL